MRIARLCLLVLLAVLVPVRGALAACMLCPDPGSGSGQTHHDCAQRSARAGLPSRLGEMPVHVQPSRAPGDAARDAHADRCPLCAACGIVAVVATAPPTLLEPLEQGAMVFPTPASPALSFVSDAQERPPRTV